MLISIYFTIFFYEYEHNISYLENVKDGLFK